MTGPIIRDLDWRGVGRWSAPVMFDRPAPPPPAPPPPSPSPPAPGAPVGIYDTEIGYGGTFRPENHQLWVFDGGCKILGVPVTDPHWDGAQLSFTGQADASRGAKPWAASVRFDADGFSGWCQFPGEGLVDWRGRRIGGGLPTGLWDIDLFYGDRWVPEAHTLRIAPGRIEIAGVEIAAPVFYPNGFHFGAQPRASRDGVPDNGSLLIAGEGFEGICQFPGEGALPWRTRPLPPHPRFGVYRTAIGIGGRWYDEGHVVELRPGAATIAGVPVSDPQFGAQTFGFGNQADATRAGKPWAGQLRFDGDDCSGWCQFPGEGPVDWRGTRIAD